MPMKEVEDDARWLAEMAGPEQWRPADARRVLAAWQASGESLAAFADAHGINPQRIAWWRKRPSESAAMPTSLAEPSPRPLQLPATTAPVASPGTLEFLPMTVKATPKQAAHAAVTLVVGGVRIEVAEPEATSPEWLACFAASLARSVA